MRVKLLYKVKQVLEKIGEMTMEVLHRIIFHSNPRSRHETSYADNETLRDLVRSQSYDNPIF